MNRATICLANLKHDAVAALVVFFVALPLCLGIAFASNAPLMSGLIAGIIGGVVTGLISGSHTSVSGPAAGLTAVIASQMKSFGAFDVLLLAIVVAGVIQIALGFARLGFIAKFVPSAVIKGLLAAIGIILLLKQLPHMLGHDADPEGEMSFFQPDAENTFTEFVKLLGDVHPGAAVIGIFSLALLLIWDKFKVLKSSPIPSSLATVALGVGLSLLFKSWGPDWRIGETHLVQVPQAGNLAEFAKLFTRPDFSQWLNLAVLQAGVVIALVASIETLINLEAVDQLDRFGRTSPPSRELVAQGVGNILCGLLGGIPVTSVIVRSSVNINAGGRTKLSAIGHGLLLLVCVALAPQMLNQIPLSALAAVLFATGLKLASPGLFLRMWREGWVQFVPFMLTAVAIVFTDLLNGVLIGLAASIGAILNSNLRRPLQLVKEKRLGGDLVRLKLATQVSFLNRAALNNALAKLAPGQKILLDATDSDFIDPDILDLIEDFAQKAGPARGIEVGLTGFQKKFRLKDKHFELDALDKNLQQSLSPREIITLLKEGNERFRAGVRLHRNLDREVMSSASGQFPVAAVLSCIDSRSPAELLFDLGVGHIFSVRIAANIAWRKVLGSLEYACAVAGAKVVVVMGHTQCGAVGAAVNFFESKGKPSRDLGCDNLDDLIEEVQLSIDSADIPQEPEARAKFVDRVALRNIERTIRVIRENSPTLEKLQRQGDIVVIGCLYDVRTGRAEFLEPAAEC